MQAFQILPDENTSMQRGAYCGLGSQTSRRWSQGSSPLHRRHLVCTDAAGWFPVPSF